MAVRFNGKKIQNRIVRPVCNANIIRTYQYVDVPVKTEDSVAETVDATDNASNAPKKAKRKNTEMTKNTQRVAQAVAVIKTNTPKSDRVVEKKDKGLYERTENSVTLLTEDDKMLLND